MGTALHGGAEGVGIDPVGNDPPVGIVLPMGGMLPVGIAPAGSISFPYVLWRCRGMKCEGFLRSPLK